MSGGRKEDARLVGGRGRYLADLVLPGMAHAVIVRSPHAHARLGAIDAAEARAMPGVLAVITPADLDVAALGVLPYEVAPPGAPGASGAARAQAALQPVLARDTVRYVGEPVVMVVAATPEAARDAAEAVQVDYAPLSAVAEATDAVAETAPPVHREFPDNVFFRYVRGEAGPTAAALAAAPRVVRLSLAMPRLAANPMEPRGYIGSYDAANGRFTLHATASKPHLLQRMLAEQVFHMPRERLRVVAGDVGGGFGSKNPVYPEQALVLVAARRIGRPVRWVGERGELMMSDAQGRDQVWQGALALDDDGRFLALAVETVANLGAYLSPRGVVPPIAGARVCTGAYDIALASLSVRAVFTHTVPTAPYRGAGQPEAMLLLERLVDVAAHRLGLSPVALRRRNLIAPTQMPYRTALGSVYDSGDFAATMTAALRLSGWEGFAARRAAAIGRGRLRGIGLSQTIEACGHGIDESATIRLDANGQVTVLIGTMSNGQSHETVYSEMVAAALGIPADAVDIVQGDTDRVPTGNGTGASRSITVGGTALQLACDRLIERAGPLAATLLQAPRERIRFRAGAFTTEGDARSVTFPEIAAALREGAFADVGGALVETARFDPPNHTFPNGCHVCEVEVDPETGVVVILAYTMVHDVGRAMNRTVVEGQLCGGVAQGIGQAMLECLRFDRQSAQIATGSFLDYAMPRADDLPPFVAALSEVASTVNPLGAKSCGEAGATAAPPAVVNAILDALSVLGVTQFDLPATPHQVWAAIRRAGAASGQSTVAAAQRDR